jgi:hypothetical protein
MGEKGLSVGRTDGSASVHCFVSAVSSQMVDSSGQ